MVGVRVLGNSAEHLCFEIVNAATRGRDAVLIRKGTAAAVRIHARPRSDRISELGAAKEGHKKRVIASERSFFFI